MTDILHISDRERTQAAVILTLESARDEMSARIEAQQWRPIETAPRDGAYILVSNPAAGGSWVAHWFPVAVSGYKFDQPWRSVMLNHWHIPEKTRYVPPTHWMPLPAAPKDKP
jgi:hypothetical protein